LQTAKGGEQFVRRQVRNRWLILLYARQPLNKANSTCAFCYRKHLCSSTITSRTWWQRSCACRVLPTISGLPVKLSSWRESDQGDPMNFLCTMAATQHRSRRVTECRQFETSRQEPTKRESARVVILHI